jgi:hypothetical protein
MFMMYIDASAVVKWEDLRMQILKIRRTYLHYTEKPISIGFSPALHLQCGERIHHTKTLFSRWVWLYSICKYCGGSAYVC